MSQLGLVLLLFLTASMTPPKPNPAPNSTAAHIAAHIAADIAAHIAPDIAVDMATEPNYGNTYPLAHSPALLTSTNNPVPSTPSHSPIPSVVFADSPRHFVLIQADTSLAFYIRIDDKVYGSSAAGHLILAPLRDSTYIIVLGFPGQVYPEQRFLLVVQGRDFGLILSHQDGEWSLLNRRGQPLDAADPPGAQERLAAGVKREDAFSRMMAAIVRDTAVMYNTELVSHSDSATVNPNDSLAGADATMAARIVASGHGDGSRGGSAKVMQSMQALRDSSNSTVGVADKDSSSRTPVDRRQDSAALTRGRDSFPTNSSIQPSPLGSVPSTPTGVVKLSEHRSARSLHLVFADRPDQSTPRAGDTIDVVIPLDSPVLARKTADGDSTTTHHSPRRTDSRTDSGSRIHKPHRTDSATTRYPATQSDSSLSSFNRPLRNTDSSRAGNSLPTDPASTSAKPADSTVVPGKSAIPFVNSDCHAFATDVDADKLKVKMQAATKDEDRLNAALKIFKTKCFTTNQIRTLTSVFGTEASKFSFLQVAYQFVSDDQFSQLIDLFADPVFAGKFQTMTGRH